MPKIMQAADLFGQSALRALAAPARLVLEPHIDQADGTARDARAAAVNWLACGCRAALQAGLLEVGFRAACASNSRKKLFSS
jgi:hypothetical protein